MHNHIIFIKNINEIITGLGNNVKRLKKMK